MSNPSPRQVARLEAQPSLSHELLTLLPGDFRLGLSTAAYQIEGGVSEGGRGPSIWDTFAHTPGLTRNDDNGDVACDHYHRWESDLDLLASLEVRHYRLSVSWSRLQPIGSGELNPEAVAFYRDLLTGMRERGIRPLVTLYHWDLPQPLEDRGGWPERSTAERFADYATRTVAALGDLVDDWITLNEPWCSAFLGYHTGAHAPGRRDFDAAVAAAHHLNLAHGLAVAGIRLTAPNARVGIANIVTELRPMNDTEADRGAVVRVDAASNRVFLDPVYLGDYSASVRDTLGSALARVIRDGDLAKIAAPTDFAGINHYQRILVSYDPIGGPLAAREQPATPATTSFGWSVIPDSLRVVLSRVSREFTDLPVYVTENGASFDDYADPEGDVVDLDRVEYLRGYLAALIDAVRDGADIRGYYAWSFLDNFEWAEGYSKRFGVVHVDYATQRRTPKLSALWYQRLNAQRNALLELVGQAG
ncbi:GH1 family beta-glucosidase [Agromyces sp. NPDC058484]|uniref:GH1 family beta-glucosidase n=1 Tax=Agromyces sp. NPDC058484 TaxID=3346524 RepID=UPI003655D74E